MVAGSDPFLPFNRPAVTGRESVYIDEALRRGKLAGVGPFGRRCNDWLQTRLDTPAVMTVSSGTHALEMAAILCDVGAGDEVILPSFAFPTTASAFARCGASLVFVDVDPGTMNVDPAAVAAAVTPRTRVIVALHYAGVSCDMDALLTIARHHQLKVVEDAAHAFLATYRGRQCGTMGDVGCFSFHETKNIHCGEGGALVVNDSALTRRAEIILEKGTDRARFFRGEVDRYTWRDLGSSYVMGELQAAFLLAQLEQSDDITDERRASWDRYREAFAEAAESAMLEVADVPDACLHNGHIFWVKLRDEEQRTTAIARLRDDGIHAVFHYVPLHASPAGRRWGRFAGNDRVTSVDASRLLRLPMFRGFSATDRVVTSLCRAIRA